MRVVFRSVPLIIIAAWVLAMAVGRTQESSSWRDPSPHRVQFATLDANVRLEVLDWGGSGQPIVLLAGAGNTAHVFDEFAPLLTGDGHVYGITRRGYGASVAPPGSDYTAERLATDVLQVLDRLGIQKAVLIGHSIAGQEISFLASKHPARVAGAVYLDGAYRYALYRPGVRDNLVELKRKLDLLDAELNKPPQAPSVLSNSIRSIMRDTLDDFQQDLRELMTAPEMPPISPQPSPSDLRDLGAYRTWSARVLGYALPEAELRAIRSIHADGGLGPAKASPEINRMIQAGGQPFTNIPVPMLAIFASPHDAGPWTRNDPAVRAAFEAFARFDEAMTERQASWVERRVVGARVVRLRHAHHYLFMSHRDEVLKEIRVFLNRLGIDTR